LKPGVYKIRINIRRTQYESQYASEWIETVAKMH